MRDVDYVLHKGTYRFKALTPKALKVFLRILDVPDNAGTITEAFISQVAEDRLDFWLSRFEAVGLDTREPKIAPPPPPSLGPPPTHLWEF